MDISMYITQSFDRIDNYYDIKQDKKGVGKGAHGMVLKGVHRKTKEERAIKVIRKIKLEDTHRFLQELEIMKMLDHPNIIKLFEVFEDKKYIYFVMELCDGKELFERIMQNGAGSSEDEARSYFIQLMRAIQYLHTKNIVHRDIKPENLLFIKPGSNHLKLIDFGISKIFVKEGDANKAINMHTKAGSLFYISPEVLEGNYDQSCDIWSAGVILHLLLLGIPPFWDENDSEVINKIKTGKIDTKNPGWDALSTEAKDLIMKMIVSHSKRISAKEVMEHPWMKKDSKSLIKPTQIDSESLIQFYKYGKLKRMALTAMAFQVSDKDIENLAQIFAGLDDDGDGLLSYNELITGLEQLGPTYKDVKQAYMKALDPKSKVNYNEFIASTMETKQQFKSEVSLKSTFALFDRDGDGKITAKELKEMLGSQEQFKNKPQSFWDDMIKEVDLNGDGELDYDEFVAMMNGKNIAT